MTQEADRMHATLLAYEGGSAGRHEQHLSCVSITRKDSDGSHMRCTTRYVQRGGLGARKRPGSCVGEWIFVCACACV